MDVLQPPRFVFSWEDDGCPKCGATLRLRVTRKRKVITVKYGAFTAIERQGHCVKHRELPPVRSRELARIIAPGANHAYDVLAHVGLARFVECRQNDEIRIDLSRRQCGIEVRPSTVGYLARKFVAYFQIAHEQSIDALRAAMKERGGYILHIDGTCEEGGGVLLLCVDSLSGQVLESRKIASENHDEVREVLRDVRRNWGNPLAIVHDLRRALITATVEVFSGTPQFVCHFHLAADVGKDILKSHQDRLRTLFRRTKVRPKLRELVRSLKKLAVCEKTGEHMVIPILDLQSKKDLREHATSERTNAAVHALASWILAYSQDGEGYGFPFDMPYLNFHERILEVHRTFCESSTVWPEKTRGALGALKRLRSIIDIVALGDQASEFREIVAATKRDRKIFERFRSALRICPKGGKKRRNDEGAPQQLSAERHKAVLQKLHASLNTQACGGGLSSRACKIVIDHLDRYWQHLFGHVLKKGIVVPRTNNLEEGLFRLVKRQCRRLHGRGHLSRDLEAMPAPTPLIILNLGNAHYCETVYGGRTPDKIAARFSDVDPKLVIQLMKTWRDDQISTRWPRKLKGLNTLPNQVVRFLAVAVRQLTP